MDTNEKNNREESRGDNARGGKKPFHKHHRHKPYPPKQADQNKEAGSAERISNKAPRFDLPPTENTADTSPKKSEREANGESRDEFRRPRHPYKKRFDRKNHLPQSAEGAGADSINVSEFNTVGETDVSLDKASEQPQRNGESGEHKRHKRRNPRRRNHEERPEREELREETEELSSSDAEDVQSSPDGTYSEYITTAGSIDAEVIDELNSITEGEAENMDMSDSDAEASIPEAELARYEIAGIRFKTGGKIYYFDPNGFKFTKGEAVIVETSRGLEYGICEIPNRTVTEREVVLPLRPVIRQATSEDTARHEANTAKEQEALAICSQKILDHKLGMKLIDVEYAFDGSKLLFYFTAEGRVDFRELVKDLAAVFRTRIELRQIGIRDETKLLGGIGICGRPFCCKTFLSDFVQVSIKMAKEQNLSLNSVKISGAYGRLMCCLRYEYDVYQEEIKKTPKVDQIVETPDGEGTVIEVQPLAGLVRVRFGTKADMITPKVYHRDDVKVIGGKGVKPKEQ